MTEGLFLLTTLFVAYVVYVIVNEKKAITAVAKKPVTSALNSESQPVTALVEPKPKTATSKPKAPATKTTVSPKPVETPAAAAKKAPTKIATAKPAAPKKAAGKTVAAPVEPQVIKGTGLKEPGGGEVAKSYTNYRFTKRWIKEALVSEGFLDKVYKNDELTPEVEAKIKAGIIKLEGMTKYQP